MPARWSLAWMTMAILFSRNEYPSPGGASGDGNDNRTGPGGALVADRLRGKASIRPGRGGVQRVCHRGSHLRRRCRKRVHPRHRHDHPICRAAGQIHPGGQRHEHGQQDRGLLRLHAGQGHQPWPRQGCSAHRAGGSSQRISYRRGRHQRRFCQQRAAPSGFRSRPTPFTTSTIFSSSFWTTAPRA
jgi:hypothetical protein